MDDGRTFTDRIDFLRRIDVGLADTLLQAAQLLQGDAASAAVALRRFAESLVRDYLCPRPAARKTLFELLDELRSDPTIPSSVIDDLDALRVIGNRGAHPSQFPGGLGDVSDGLHRAWEVAAWFHSRRGGRPEDVPAYEAPTPFEGAIIFREAVLGGPDGFGDPVAKYHVAKAILAQDHGRLRDLKEGRSFLAYTRHDEIVSLLRHAIHEVPAARTDLALSLLEKSALPDAERQHALDMLDWAVEDNDPEGTFWLGAFNLEGMHGLVRNLRKATELFEKAARCDEPRALNALAMLYRDGRGVEVDPIRARSYAEQSARAGFPIGQHQLANFLLGGVGGPKDPDEALVWLRRASRQEWPLAWFHLAVLIFDGDIDAAPGEDSEHLLDRACRAQCVEALRWRADRELAKANDDVDFSQAFRDLRAIERSEQSPGDRDARRKLRATRRRLDDYLRQLRRGSERHRNLSFLWSQVNEDGSAKFESSADVAKNFMDFQPDGNGGTAQTDESLRQLVRATAGPGVTEAETNHMFNRLKAEKLGEPPPRVPKVGRNEPCPCSSGRKYKHCHGR